MILPDLIKNIKAKASSFLNEDILDIETIEGGMSNYNFKIYTARDIYVLRIPGKASDLLISRDDECEILRILINKALDVETIFFDTDSGWKITRFIEDIFPSESMIRKISTGSSLLFKLHHSGIIFKNQFSIIQKIEQYESIMYKNKISFENDYSQIKNLMKDVQKFILPRQNILVPCHNDIVPENILLDKSGKSFLIDWEYAGMNDPLFDIASFSLENNLDTFNENKFLRLYLKTEPTEEIVVLIFVYKIFQDILWSHWSSIKTHFGSDYSKYGKARYERGIKNLKKLIHL